MTSNAAQKAKHLFLDKEDSNGETKTKTKTNKKNETTSKKTTQSRCCFQVAIVGAGASGLQCAHDLVTKHGYDPSDIILLEARDRIGGRIHTTQEEKRRRKTTDAVDGQQKLVVFSRDHGAAWVHGTGLDWGVPLQNDDNQQTQTAIPMLNPMMTLLQQATPHGECVYRTHLQRIFQKDGNPWMRPRAVLLQQQQQQQQQQQEQAGEILLYVEGGGERPLDKDSSIVAEALKRHFAIFDAVSKVGQDLFQRGLGMDTARQSLQETIDTIVQRQQQQQQQEEEEDNSSDDLCHFSEKDRQLIQALTPFFQHLCECWYGSAASDLQLCEFVGDEDSHSHQDEELVFGDDSVYTEEGDFFGPHCTLKHGMKTVLEPLLRNGILERVRLGEEVVKIKKTNDDDDDSVVTIETSTGAIVHANVCVVTIPAGCLKEAVGSVHLFEPELCISKLKAIASRNMGSYKKVFLTFDRIFWPKKEPFLGMVRTTKEPFNSNPLGNYLLFDNLWARDSIPCIEAILFGPAGEWAAHKTEKEIGDAVMEFMMDAMSLKEDIKAYCEDCHVTRWEEDRFSRGAYSSIALGAVIRHTEELQRPEWEGRLIFSGEATISEFEGSVHAALLSGMNAGKMAHACLSRSRGVSEDTE